MQIRALLDQICIGDGTCSDARGGGALNPLLQPTKPGKPGRGGKAPTSVTSTDVARFLPALGALHTEPDGWAAVGTPTNFWADVTAITVDGRLLGGVAQVRFTPQLFRWSYGDGFERVTATAGSSWASLHQDELTDTPTSHVYTTRAKRETAVEVVYSAEYRIGAGRWLPVVGAVVASPTPAPLLVVSERTVLTAG
ncbi:hypothetical protein QDR37_03265 [Amnibacterium sp. CER49]|uniref:hypothetical protein n=1 Tax=Amnibacterium sp. CER49 TaxID=3039161 RepID=UPI002446FF54|nr:hypothetical protein [Amnibacterium sp. CER49]MDH2442958.1 hypothetical protein [Amnibacterium sp. CER49]